MKKDSNSKVVVHIHYNEGGKTVNELLRQSIQYYIESEVKKRCIEHS